MGFSVERRRAAVRVAVVSRHVVRHFCGRLFIRGSYAAFLRPLYSPGTHTFATEIFSSAGRGQQPLAGRASDRVLILNPLRRRDAGCRKHGEPEGGYRRTYEWFFVRERPSVAAIDRDRLSDRKSRSAHSAERLFRLFAGRYSASRISSILIAAVAIGVPGPKIAAAPALYRSS